MLHSASLWPVLAARLASPHGGAGVLRLQGFEMLKGLRGKGCFDEVLIPIIPNTARESERDRVAHCRCDVTPMSTR